MKINPLTLRDISRGVVERIDYNSLGAKDTSANFALNLRFDKTIGRAVVREGTALVGAQIANGKECLGLFQYIKSDGTTTLMAVFNDATDTNSDIYKYA